MKVFGVVGWSGSGCSSLLSRLSGYLSQRGLRVSVVKHYANPSNTHWPVAETRQFHQVGCVETLMVTPEQWYLSHKTSSADDGSLDRILENMEEVDLVLVKGFKQMGHPKVLLVHPRRKNQLENTQLLATACPRVVALAANDAIPALKTLSLPVITQDLQQVADFISEYCQLPLKAPITAIEQKRIR